ncbi:MAG: molybdenum cofactor biosynthesis protein MoaE [Flavobacteriales bacterium]|nr:molybdenum cofactor biosynthesis protein MoaE [Flavobacteriales bacterium]
MQPNSATSKKKKVFIEGSITPAFIGDAIAKHSTKTEVGAHSIFLGQVRADVHGDKTVAAIEYTAYTEMAEEKLSTIREEAFAAYPLTCMHIYHSLGIVPAGGVCLFIFTSSPHREDCMKATDFLVEKIKKKVHIFGKKIYEDATHTWKVNR